MAIKAKSGLPEKRDSKGIKAQLVPQVQLVHEDHPATKEHRGQLVTKVCEEKWEGKAQRGKTGPWV